MQIRCPVCDYTREVNLDKVPPTAEFATCPKCRHRFRFRAVDLDAVEHAGPPEPDPDHEDVWDAVDSLPGRWEKDHAREETDDGSDEDEAPHHGGNVAIPWENPRYLGYRQSFVKTTLWALLQPASFFATLTRRPALLPALSFYLLFGIAQYIINIFWTYLLGNMVRDRFIENMGEEAFQRIVGNVIENSLLTPAVLAVPFQLAIQVFVTAALVHLLIRIINPQRSDFFLSFKVVAYAAAGFALVAVPIAGSILAPMAYLALLLIGCRNAFVMPWGRTLTVMIPLYLLLFFVATAQYTHYLG